MTNIRRMNESFDAQFNAIETYTEPVKESYELLSGTNVELYRDYGKASARAKELGLKEAEYGDAYGVSYCMWNTSGDRNEDEEVIAYYKFGGRKPVPLDVDDVRRVAREIGVRPVDFDDFEDFDESVEDGSVMTDAERKKFIRELTKGLTSKSFGYSKEEANDIAIKRADSLDPQWRTLWGGDVSAQVRQELRHSAKKVIESKLSERNLTKAERHNRDMERIFANKKKFDDNYANFLKNKGYSDEQIKKLRDTDDLSGEIARKFTPAGEQPSAILSKILKEERNNYGHKGPWWYFTLHGLGPGMIPKDVGVVDSVEGVNKKGTRGLFIALDGVLTYDELKKYDLIELAPPKAMTESRKSCSIRNHRLVEEVVLKSIGKYDIIKDGYGFGVDDGYSVNRFFIDNDGTPKFDSTPTKAVMGAVKSLISKGAFNNPHYKGNDAKFVGNTMRYGLGITEDTVGSNNDYYFRAFITNLGKYNEGYLIGEWVDFPVDENRFNDILKRNQIADAPYEEWFVTDYESNLPGFDWNDLGEYANYDELNEFGEKVDEINRSGQGRAIANAYEVTDDLQEAIDGILDGNIIFYDGIYSDYDLGEMVINDVFGGEISDNLVKQYFDFDALGRDLRLEYSQEDDDMPETAGEYWTGDETATDYDIGEAFVRDVGIDGVANKDYYFDFEAFGRDLFFENFHATTDGVIEMS